MNSQSECLYHPIFTFSPPQFKPNKLLDKMVPAIEVDTLANTIKCKDGDIQVAIIRAQHSLPTTAILSYFQVQVLKCNISHPDDCGVNVGLITKDGNPRAYAGKYMNSIGLINGQVYLNKKKVSSMSGVHFGKKDRIGCGINCLNWSFFFTKNGEIFIKDIVLPQGNKWNEFYPAVALQYQQETVRCCFEKKEFVFDIDKLAKEIEQKVQSQILISEQQEIPSSEIYSLISQYMLFNGYSKTLQLMKQKKNQIQFEPVNKLTKSIPGTKLLINLDQEYKIKQQIKQQQQQQIINQQQEKQQKLKQKRKLQQFAQQIQQIPPIEIKQQRQSYIQNKRNRSSSRSARQRIMSEAQPQIMPQQSLMIEQQNQPRRKNTEMGEYAFIGSGEYNNNYGNNKNNKLRKQSNLSNVSLIDQQQINHNIAQEKILNNNHQNSRLSENIFQQALSLNQRFLLNQRLQILSLIKDKKIQCAEKIIISKIPKLYEIQPLLQAHMKAHIFLRKIIEQDQNSAIIYGRTEPKFANNIDKLFPSYDQETGLIQMIPMKKILTSIVVSKNKQHKFLTKEQFEYFAEYVNSLIMKCMGVMGNSRLGVILQHTSIALRKLQQFKGMACGIKLTN